ncbi:MAG: hypothetical protein A3A43_00860 [Candidatus Liptonbacteria bacterium RIFCSPLOWO2_01_FULL_56_20]|uniref:DUF5673 domain-containing protein n=1 Tax=Candidatus Liptonbacteria bacterium RIFCSPLOWO2_01_FULL_56_20 TaxID=1798652 RepID=A0A1G2CHM9_9BACT|nr:MAG: hypothetical protein UY96_C0020G0002 [Parcubacteria group bacterium GW2011_GWB1_56_8]OGY98312.1 MAG: hypothetical protein A2681_01300 [Candidatus Liptonbacteria bacterium RIFCSPHIGHO2_01_FULL_56_18b]OGZ00727.1 MAG: hypothetical protein A3A43_00860 [Candidatus Liptonbacteria bacterium RIFCSPLOWO2_01_FULL_56_20]
MEWQAPEFEYQPKRTSWYWTSVLIAIVALAVAVWQRNFLFGVFVVVAEMLLMAWAAREPQTRTFSLTAGELKIDDQRRRYPLATVENFSVDADNQGEWRMITLAFKNKLHPTLRVLVPKDRLAEFEHGVGPGIPKIELQESLLDVLEKFIRF